MTRVLLQAPLHWSAGGEYALVAVRCLIDSGVALNLTLSGDGPDRDRLLFAIADMRLDHAVSLRPPAEQSDAYTNIDIFLLPAVRDGDWPTLAHAVAAGLPVVASKLPTIEKMVGSRDLLVPPRQPAEIASALKRMGAA